MKENGMTIRPSFASYYLRNYSGAALLAIALLALSLAIPSFSFMEIPLAAFAFVASVLVLAGSVIGAAVRVSSSSLALTDDAVVYELGIISKLKRSVPLGKITDISIQAGVFDRLVAVAGMRINTSGTDEYEIAVEGFPAGDVQKMHDSIYAKLKRKQKN